MEIIIDKRVNRTIISCSGKLDAMEALDFEKQVLPLVEPENLPITFDFSRIKYMSSAGIRSIILLLSKAKNIAATSEDKYVHAIRFVNMNDEIKQVFKLSGINRFISEKPKIENVEKKQIETRTYKELISKIQTVFPSPVHDPIQDAYLVQSIARGINKIDELKTERPYLGEREELDYDKSRNVKMTENFSTLESSIDDIANYMHGLTIWGHPRTQENVLPPTTIPSIIGNLYSSIYNPNIISDEYSQRFSLAEIEVSAMSASLVGYDSNKSVGFSTFGGTGTIFYGIKLGIEKAIPDAFINGVREVVKSQKRKIHNLRDSLVKEYDLQYIPHVHADAVIGWAWSVFNDYDFQANPMDFSERALRSLWDTQVNLSKLNMADSIGFDFHKTGYGPYVSSLFLLKDKNDLELIHRAKESMPYLFQYGNYHPGMFTMETSRSGGSVLSALANLKFLGKEGYRVILGHIVSMAEHLRAKIDDHKSICLVNNYNYGPVTLFRVYPNGMDANIEYHKEISGVEMQEQLEKYNHYNRKVFEELNKQMEAGQGAALSLTEKYRETSYGKPIIAIKSFVMSPLIDIETMDLILELVEKAREAVDKG